MKCPTCARPLAAVAGSSLVTCTRCQKTHVPAAATELSLIARTQVGEARPVATIALPREFRDRYELGEVLGSGAMGMVCRARDRSMNREVAVKFLMLIDQPELLQRFLTEGRLLARIRHENVVPVYDLEDLGGHPYIVTECLEGGTLRQLLDSRALSTAEAIEIMSACLDGLAACHAAGIVHRDLKPENILFTKDRIPKISDLGIAKEMTATSVTKTGALIGTPRYMAPEQARTASASYASDVHAMGAILHEMVTGDPPFEAENLADLLRDIMTQVPRALDEGMATPLPPALVRVVARALEKAPEARPTAEEFAAELRKAAASRALAPRVEPRPATPRGIVTTVAPAAPRWPLVPAAFGVLSLVILAPILLGLHRPRPAQPAMSPRLPATAIAPSMAAGMREDLRAELVRRQLECLEALKGMRELRARIYSTPWGPQDHAAARALHERFGQLNVRMRDLLKNARAGGDSEKASLDAQAVLADAEVTDWEVSLESLRLQRFLQSVVDPEQLRRVAIYRGDPRRVLLALTGSDGCSIEECVKLQRTLQSIRRALSRPLTELALAPIAVESLLITFERIAQLLSVMSYEARRNLSTVMFDPNFTEREQESRRLASAVDRIGAAVIPLRAKPGDPVIDRVLAALWKTFILPVGLRGDVNPEIVATIRRDLQELRSALGPGALSRLIAHVETAMGRGAR